MKPAANDLPLATLRRHWGYDSFRPLQREIVDSVLDGRDTLGLMPTGGGKSVTFQVPGMILGGVTIVVTPLISLMKDQVDNLRRRRIKAVCLHSGMTSRELCVDLLHKTGVVTVPGSGFGQCGEGYIRMAYAASDENIRKGFERIGDYIERMS